MVGRKRKISRGTVVIDVVKPEKKPSIFQRIKDKIKGLIRWKK
jgi:hypothetical protein